MVANKAALPYLPAGADINTLSYDELAAWAGTIQQKTGKPLLDFPAGPIALRRHQPSLRLRCCRTTPTATSPRNTTRSDLIGRFWGDTALERRVVPEDQHENGRENREERDDQHPGADPAGRVLQVPHRVGRCKAGQIADRVDQCDAAGGGRTAEERGRQCPEQRTDRKHPDRSDAEYRHLVHRVREVG